MKFIVQYVFGLSVFLSLVQYASGETFGKYFELILGGGQATQTSLSSSERVGRRQLPPSWRFASVMAKAICEWSSLTIFPVQVSSLGSQACPTEQRSQFVPLFRSFTVCCRAMNCAEAEPVR